MTVPTSTPPQRPTITETIARARQINDKRITTTLQRVEDAVDRLYDTINEYESKAAARREVERLERQLAEAKARLRGGQQASEGNRGRPAVCKGLRSPLHHNRMESETRSHLHRTSRLTTT